MSSSHKGPHKTGSWETRWPLYSHKTSLISFMDGHPAVTQELFVCLLRHIVHYLTSGHTPGKRSPCVRNKNNIISRTRQNISTNTWNWAPAFFCCYITSLFTQNMSNNILIHNNIEKFPIIIKIAIPHSSPSPPSLISGNQAGTSSGEAPGYRL